MVIAKYPRPGVSAAGRSAVRPSALAPEDRCRADDAWIAQRIALDAGTQAAMLKRQASAQAAAIRETAERETEKIWHQASAQAAAIRETAERETTELRAAVMKLSAGVGESGNADGNVAYRPAGTPPRPATKSGARGRANTKGRQIRVMRKVVIAFVVLSLAGATSGAVEIKLHGLGFFLFRNAGAGAGNSRDLDENQGPGQPDAPKHRVNHSHRGNGAASG
jgi:hypothetical protein